MSTSSQISPERSGIYAMPADVSHLREEVRASRGAWFDVDLANVRDKASLLRALAAPMRFPQTFGENWDALADMLEDLSWHPASHYVVTIKAADAARKALGDEWSTFIDILEETTSYWRDRKKAFVAFVETRAALPEWK